MNWNDKPEVLAAVAQNGWALKYASKTLRGDRDVALVAVTQDGYALEYASEELQTELSCRA